MICGCYLSEAGQEKKWTEVYYRRKIKKLPEEGTSFLGGKTRLRQTDRETDGQTDRATS